MDRTGFSTARKFTSVSWPQARVTQVARATAVAVGCWAGMAGASWADVGDAQRIQQLEDQLQRSNQLIDALTARVQQLESRIGAAPPTTAQAPAPAAMPGPAPASNAALEAKVDDLEHEVADLSNRPEEDHGLPMHGFADVGFATGPKGHNAGGNIGKLDFYLAPKLGDRILGLSELNFEVGKDGVVSVDLERLQLGYIASDELTVWAGRFHTPYGYWNTAFHHGAQLQTTVERPLFLEFEDQGGILPAHTVGLWGHGGFRLNSGKLNYDAFVGNAPTIQGVASGGAGSGVIDPGLNGAQERRASLGGNLSYAFKGDWDGLNIGGHVYGASAADDQAAPDRTLVKVWGPWFAYTADDWEILGEFYAFIDKDLTGGTGTHKSEAGYLQVGRTFGQWTPYARFERTGLNQADNYFAMQASGVSYKRGVLGVRYDLSDTTALKFEIDHTSDKDRSLGSYSALRSQFAVRF